MGRSAVGEEEGALGPGSEMRKVAELGQGWAVVWAHPRDVLIRLGSVTSGKPQCPHLLNKCPE